ncbi:MAG: hypothetical protein A4E53_01924 [Pelotomaculum sp. PtaB.Bin104]|nr:MAG: hypothetical protein A4E53_01924 [Pelotomaculum sp. PtaB.Bin104]
MQRGVGAAFDELLEDVFETTKAIGNSIDFAASNCFHRVSLGMISLIPWE